MYGVSKSVHKTTEERAAQKISAIVSDFTLDLEKVGYYLATATPYINYVRSIEILEAAQFNKEKVELNRSGYYSDTLF